MIRRPTAASHSRPLAAATLLATLLVGLALPGSATAQSPDQPVPLDEILDNPGKFAPRVPSYAWLPGEPLLFETVRGEDGQPDVLNRVDPARQVAEQRTKLLDAESFRARLAEVGVKLPPGKRLPRLQPLGGSQVRVSLGGTIWHWDFNAGKPPERILDLPQGAQRSKLADDDAAIAWVTDDDLFVKGRDGEVRRLTWDGQDGDIDYGTGAHRSEFGIRDGLFWDATGRRLAFTREDLRPIAPYPYAQVGEQPPTALHGRYPMAGLPHSKVTVGVYDRQTARLVYLEHDPALDVYQTNITFSPDGSKIYVAQVARSQDNLQLVEFDSATGARQRVVLAESDPEWVEPEHGPIFPPDGDGILWFSDRGGYRQVWRVSDAGEFLYPETDQRVDVTEFLGFSADGKSIRVMAHAPDPRERHLFEVRLGRPLPPMALQSGPPKTQRLTASIGFHTCQISDTGWILDSWSQLYHPGLVQAFRPGGRRMFLHQADDPLAGWQRPNHRFFEVAAEDGTPLYGHVMFPSQVDTLRKSPVLLYVYGGPHSQLVQHRWLGGANLWLYHMASRGYIVVRLDGRGTSNRGIDFAQAIHRGVGEIEVIDQLAALDEIGRTFPFADLDHVGVHGWSYGGYMTLRLMTLAPDQFKAAIAGAPVTDWAQYETGYTERYMDTPQENPEGYASSSVLPLAEALQGRLMVVHGTDDRTVMWSHAMRFLNACIDAGKPVDFMAYPMQRHGLSGKARSHFYRKMTAFFLEQLPLPEPLPPLGAVRAGTDAEDGDDGR